MGHAVINGPKLSAMFKFFLWRTFPKLASKLKIRLLGGKIYTFFESLILDTMAEREKKNIFRPDMINIVMQVRQGNLNKEIQDEKPEANEGFATVSDFSTKTEYKKEWSDHELIAQVLFFVILMIKEYFLNKRLTLRKFRLLNICTRLAFKREKTLSFSFVLGLKFKYLLCVYYVYPPIYHYQTTTFLYFRIYKNEFFFQFCI